jgi:hypothetical protein
MARSRPANIIFPLQIDASVREGNPAEYPCRCLAEGDSWFSFGSWKLDSLLQQVRFRRETAIVSLAQPGDTIRRMSSLCANPGLARMFSGGFGYDWDAILLSGGGNDIIDDASKIIPPSATTRLASEPVEMYLDLAALERTLGEVVAGYMAIVELRDGPDSICPLAPIVTHTYDLATPRNAPATFLFLRQGPWLYPAMVAARIPESRWNEVADYILRELAERIAAQGDALPNFHVTPTLGTLSRAAPGATGNSNDWDNEIHPNRRGYRKLGDLMSQVIESVIP